MVNIFCKNKFSFQVEIKKKCYKKLLSKKPELLSISLNKLPYFAHYRCIETAFTRPPVVLENKHEIFKWAVGGIVSNLAGVFNRTSL